MFNQYPYINENDLNLDYVLKSIKKLKEIVDEFVTLNTITFADPITWNISTQYARNTVVIDVSGNAYLSKVAVPAGVQLNNSDYWLEIFNFTEYTRTANQNLTVNVETNTTRATAAYAVDDWLLWNDVLYKVIVPIAIDDTFITTPDAGANIEHFTVEDFIKAFITYATNLINQYKNDIDASELEYRQQLAIDIANTTQSLQTQLNAAIAGATVDSEVINARIAYDGVATFNTLGNAIRQQITLAYNDLDIFNSFLDKMVDIPESTNDADYNLDLNGVGTAANGYTLHRFPFYDLADNYDYFYIEATSGSPCVFRFGINIAAVASSVVGPIYQTGFKGIIKKPTGGRGILIAMPTGQTPIFKAIPTDLYKQILSNPSVFGYTNSTVVDTNPNYYMDASGGGEGGHSGFTLDKIKVMPGEKVFIDANYCGSPVIWRFASSQSGLSSSVVGALHTAEYHGFYDVPAGAHYLFVVHKTADTTVNCMDRGTKRNCILRGLMFIWAHNGTLHIKTSSTCTLIFNGSVVNIGDLNLSLVYYGAAQRYIVYNGNEIKIAPIDYKIGVNELLLARMYNRQVWPLINGVITNDTPLIDSWYQRSGIPVYINRRKLNNYNIMLSMLSSAQGNDFGDFLKLNAAYNYPDEVVAYKTDLFIDTFAGNTKFVENVADIGGLNVLTIGDSFTKRGWYQQQILDHAPTVNFVGTQTTNYNNLLCEGYSGATAKEILQDSATSPFWNGSAISYADYESNNNISADIIVINFGLNEFSGEQYYTAVQNFIDNVKAYNPSIKIYVVQPCTDSKAASTSQLHYVRRLATYEAGVYWYDLTDCTLIPMRTTLIDEYDYESDNLNYGYQGLTVKGTSDAIHPSKLVGFAKIGDQIYNYLGV